MVQLTLTIYSLLLALLLTIAGGLGFIARKAVGAR